MESVSEEAEDTLTLEDEYEEDWEYEDPVRRNFSWLAPALAIVAAIAWTAFFGWAHLTDLLAGGTPQQWANWIVSWAIPVLLIVSLWILAMRNSRREAERFGTVANTLSTESALLERRLTTVNRELSLAREFLGSQSRELDSVGRIAAERLSEHAGRLETLVMSNSTQIDQIADVSGKALENMDRLRDDLPVIANTARDVSNQIGGAGRMAHSQIEELIIGFGRLNEFGQASENQVKSIQEKIAAGLKAFEVQALDMTNHTETRFGILRETNEAFRTDLDGREVEALAAMRRRADALGEEFAKTRVDLEEEEEEALRSLRARLSAIRDEAGVVGSAVKDGEDTAMELLQGRVATLKTHLTETVEAIHDIDSKSVDSANNKLKALTQEAQNLDEKIADREAKVLAQIATRRHTIAQDEAAAIAAFTQRLDILDDAISERREAHLTEADSLTERSEAVAQRIDGLRHSIDEITQLGGDAQASMSENADRFTETLSASHAMLENTDSAVRNLTEASVRLLELIQASAKHGGEELPEALALAESRLGEVRQQAEGLKGIIGEAGAKSEDLSRYVMAAREAGEGSIKDVEAMHSRMAEANAGTQAALGQLGENLSVLNEQSDVLSAKAQDQLREAIAALQEAALNAPAAIEISVRETVLALAANVGKETGEVLDRTLQESASEALLRLEEATRQAETAGRDTAIQLRDQLAKVNELAGNLENRVTRARERAEEQVGNDFARRVALITESLNSHSIDIAKAIDTDVTDTSWASYLRGDRGIFTRRAVRLLDNVEAREIAEIYDEDTDFREHVSRYIHDFEAMLRNMLSTRDGNALGVTLLSSDMGKLYVALAQAIERLRE